MRNLKAVLRSIFVVSLLVPALYACGSESLPSATAVPTSVPTVALPPTPTLFSGPSGDTTGTEDVGTSLGLPGGVFRNSQTQSLEQGAPQQVLPQRELLQIRSTDLPGVRELGPPDWVRPGTRITFYAAGATIVARGELKCTEDPNGDWEDDKGSKYKCTGMPGEADGSSSGDGLSQIDVLAVEGRDVVMATTLYGIDRISNTFTIAPTGGGKGPGDVIDGVWIHPARLAEIAESNVAGLKVLRGNYTVEDVTYKAISFISTAPGSYQSYAYDSETGLLIASTTRSTSAGTSTTLLTPPQTAEKGTQLYIRRLLGYRQRNAPGLNGTNPAWVARTKQLNYKGTWNFTNPMGSYGDSMTFPMDLGVTLGKGGKNWVPFTSKSIINMGYPQESTGTGVTGSAGQYWIDPRALAKLKKGQVIDQDPRTQEKLVVDSILNRGGTKTIAISSELPGNRSLFTYDLTTGVLVDFQTSASNSGITILLQLQNRPR